MKKFFEILSAALFLAVTVTWAAALSLAGPALLKLCILYLFGYGGADMKLSKYVKLVKGGGYCMVAHVEDSGIWLGTR